MCQGEFVGTGSARASNESRRQAFLALYESLPTALEDRKRGPAA